MTDSAHVRIQRQSLAIRAALKGLWPCQHLRNFGPLAISDKKLGSAVFVPSVVSGVLSTDLVSSGSSVLTAKAGAKASSSRSASAPGGRRARTRGRTPTPVIRDDAMAVARPGWASAALRTISSPSLAATLTSRAQHARSQQIEQRRGQLEDVAQTEVSVVLVAHIRSTSEQGQTRSMTESIAAAVVEAEFRIMTEELDKSREETSWLLASASVLRRSWALQGA